MFSKYFWFFLIWNDKMSIDAHKIPDLDPFTQNHNFGMERNLLAKREFNSIQLWQMNLTIAIVTASRWREIHTERTDSCAVFFDHFNLQRVLQKGMMR